MNATLCIPDEDAPLPAHPFLQTRFSRRSGLKFAGLLAASLLFGSQKAWSATESATEGPYWVDEMLNRSNITTDPSDGTTRTGVPLSLTIKVLREEDSAPVSGLQVDVWHCDASGLYSDEAANNTVGKKFLRGYQLTDDSGAVQFTTIFPGWYSGRTIHIHVRVRQYNGSTTTTNFTSQIFFADATSNQVLAVAPYNTRGTRDTTNSNDNIYHASLLMPVTGDTTNGFAGAFNISLANLTFTGSGTDSGSGSTILGDALAALSAALPVLSNVTTGAQKRATRALLALNKKLNTATAKVATASGSKRARLLKTASLYVNRMTTLAQKASDKGTLTVALADLNAAIQAVIMNLPAE